MFLRQESVHPHASAFLDDTAVRLVSTRMRMGIFFASPRRAHQLRGLFVAVKYTAAVVTIVQADLT